MHMTEETGSGCCFSWKRSEAVDPDHGKLVDEAVEGGHVYGSAACYESGGWMLRVRRMRELGVSEVMLERDRDVSRSSHAELSQGSNERS